MEILISLFFLGVLIGGAMLLLKVRDRRRKKELDKLPEEEQKKRKTKWREEIFWLWHLIGFSMIIIGMGWGPGKGKNLYFVLLGIIWIIVNPYRGEENQKLKNEIRRLVGGWAKTKN